MRETAPRSRSRACRGFRREQCAAKRRLENRADAGPDTRCHGDAAVVFIQVEHIAEPGAESSGNLCRRSFATGAAPRADGDGRRQQLDGWNADAYLAPVVMKRLDGGVRAVALGLRCEGIDDEAAEQAPERGDHGNQPGSGDRL